MRSILWLAVLAAGCEKTDPLYCPQGTCSDAHAVADTIATDTPPAPLCLGATTPKWSVCAPMPTDPVMLPGQLHTDSDSKCQSGLWTGTGQPDACFIVGTSITMTGDTLVDGVRPLVLIA